MSLIRYFIDFLGFFFSFSIVFQVLYVMQVEACLKREKASIVSISHYTLTLPILSQAIISAEKATFTSQTINVGPSPSKSAEIDYFSYSDDSRTGNCLFCNRPLGAVVLWKPSLSVRDIRFPDRLNRRGVANGSLHASVLYRDYNNKI